MIDGTIHHRNYHAIGREGGNYVVRDPYDNYESASRLLEDTMTDKPITLGHDATGHEPKVGKIELFPDQHTSAIHGDSVTANDLISKMMATPPGAIGSFMPVDQVAVNREEALKRERRYQLLQAAAVIWSTESAKPLPVFDFRDAVDDAEKLLEEIERRNP